MAPIRLHRSQWWLLIPLGWTMVGVVGHWLVWPMVLVTVLLGGGFARFGGTAERHQVRQQRRKEHWQRHQEHLAAQRARWEQQRGQADPRVDLTKRAPETLVSLSSSPRIPADIRERAQRLDREAVSVLTYLREHGAPTAQVFEVEQIQTDFGPQALRSYLALAPGTEDTDEVLDGKTGHQLIVEQLDLLLAQVDAHLHRASRLGSDELLANHRFLTEKFGHRGDSELTI